MNRQELYRLVKKYYLAEDIKKKFDKNYTIVSNAELEDFVYNAVGKEQPKDVKAVKPVKKDRTVIPDNTQKKIEEFISGFKGTANKQPDYSKVFVRLISTLQFKKLLTTEEVDDILSLLV